MNQEGLIVQFPKALPGFPDLREFRLFEPEGGYPLRFLQAVGSPDVSFTCMDAATVKLDYEVPLGDEDRDLLGIAAPEEALVLAIVVLPTGDPRRMTANLAGPIVINTRTRVGCQVQLDTRIFPLEYPVLLPPDQDILRFEGGLIGFPTLKRFQLLEPPDAYPLKFLHPVDREDIHFVAIDVAAIKPDYQVPLTDEEAQELAIEEPADALVLALVVIPPDPRHMTANLAGPILVNLKTRAGRQIVLNSEKYPLKFPVVGDK
ncbi:MAG TPA: flagellar assembly protein FliW [Holophaga sp.]|nr:flagellar assembly protein FliW [Holophaga sp.]